MANIGGNIYGVLQVNTAQDNAIGESVKSWTDAITDIPGWLGLQNGEQSNRTYNAKIEESTHVFLCDFFPAVYALAAQDTRMIIKGFVYDVTFIDNPDEMDEQLEIFLRRVGAVNG